MFNKNINSEIQKIRQLKEKLFAIILEEEKELLKNGGKLKPRVPLITDDLTEYELEEYKKLKESLADHDFLNRIKDKIEQIPVSNGSEYFEKFNVDIGIVADEFLYNSYKDIANFHYITLDNYKNYIGKLDVFLLVSTWKGLNGEWRGLANPNNTEMRQKVQAMINDFRNAGAKIVFYSKEDPTNYERFIGLAQMCDYIFTTAKEVVKYYIRDCDNRNVSVLEFGVNPIYNNPIGIRKFNDGYNDFIFAGSWYKKYEKRQEDTKRIFNAVINAKKNLKIVDRNFHLDNPNHLFPVNYLSSVTPAIPHEDLQKVLKLFPFSINLNSIQFSETMFANRVYELQAMGRIIVSNYSLGINNKFPNILMIFNEDEIDYLLKNVPEERLYELQLQGIRAVLNKDTTYHRISYLLNSIGIETGFTEKKVAVVVDDKNNENIIANFERQSYKNKEMILESELEDKYNEFDYVTFFNDTYFYGEYYLEDLINGFKFTKSDFITKDSYYENGQVVKGIEHNYIDSIKDIYKTVFSLKSFTINEILNETFEHKKGYSIDNTEIDVLPQTSIQSHADFELSLIIPVYNNGKHLYNKCFLSLEKSSIFNKMEIVIVDDGSTDKETIDIIQRIKRKYSNVRTFFFNDGGSGSASRPRNKGVELASTDYITFLDPDNEAVNDGYAKLFKEMKENDVDMVVGNIKKIGHKEIELNYSNTVYTVNTDGYINDTKDFLIYSNLKAQSIQALIVKKHIITENNLEMVVGAAGQDTLFFQQLLIHSNKVKVIPTVIHLYYSEVSNSVTNLVTKRFFEKYLILERERIKFLKQHNLLNHYVDKRLPTYFKGWYLVRVPRLMRTDYEEAIQTLFEIYSIYKPYISYKFEPFKRLEKAIKSNNYNEFVDYCIKIINKR